MNRRLFCVKGILCPLLFIAVATAQQPINLQGTITNAANQQPISGALVWAKANNKAVMASTKGAFHLSLLRPDTLIISAHRFQTQYQFIRPTTTTPKITIALQPIQPLGVGSSLPPIRLPQVWQQHPTTIHPVTNPATTVATTTTNSLLLSSLAPKSIILDFFATWCTACIQSLPKLDSLQRIYNQQLQIILVTHESPQVIANFFQRHPQLPIQHLRFACNDSLLSQLFPHRFIPHVVWVGATGTINAITDGAAISATAVQQWLSNKTIHLPTKADKVHYNRQLSLSQNLSPDSLLQATISATTLTKRILGLGSLEGIYRNNQSVRVSYINRPLLVLYQKYFQFPNNRVLLQVNNPERFTQYDADTKAWEANNLFCYEATAPASTPDSILLKNMVTTLNQSLGFQATMQVRNMPVWLLKTRTTSLHDSLPLLAAMPDSAAHSQLMYTLQQQPIEQLLQLLNATKIPTNLAPIILNESGIQQPISIQIPKWALGNIEALQAALAPYGLALVPALRSIPVFVLSQTDSSAASSADSLSSPSK